MTDLAGVYAIWTVGSGFEHLCPALETAYEMVPEPGSLLLVGTALILGAGATPPNRGGPGQWPQQSHRGDVLARRSLDLWLGPAWRELSLLCVICVFGFEEPSEWLLLVAASLALAAPAAVIDAPLSDPDAHRRGEALLAPRVQQSRRHIRARRLPGRHGLPRRHHRPHGAAFATVDGGWR